MSCCLIEIVVFVYNSLPVPHSPRTKGKLADLKFKSVKDMAARCARGEGRKVTTCVTVSSLTRNITAPKLEASKIKVEDLDKFTN